MTKSNSVAFTVVAASIALLIGGSFVPSVIAQPDPNAKARAIQEGVSLDEDANIGTIGPDIDCVGGIDSDAEADMIICYLLPDGVPTPNYNTDPSVISQSSTDMITCPDGAGFGSGDDCFSSTFDGSLFSPGHWRFVIEFYKDGNLIALAGTDWRNHSFLVIPESPIGIAALVLSSLAALGGFMFLKNRKSSGTPLDV